MKEIRICFLNGQAVQIN